MTGRRSRDPRPRAGGVRGWGQVSPGRLVLAAAVGLTLLAGAVKRWDAAATWQAMGGRGHAVGGLRTAAQALGIELRGGETAVRGRWDLEAALGGPAPGQSLLRDVRWESDGGDVSLEATFSGGGGLHSLEVRSPPLDDAFDRTRALSLAQRFAEDLELLPNPAPRALPSPEVEQRGTESWRIRWRWSPETAPDTHQVLEVSLRSGRITEVRRTSEGEDGPSLVTRREDFVRLLSFLVALAALIYAVQSRRFDHPHRNGLALARWMAALGAAGVLLTFEQRSFGGGGVGAFLAALFDPILLRAGSAWMLFGAGCAAARLAVPGAVRQLETVLAGTPRRRPIGRTVAAALAAGPWFALAVYCIAGAGLESGWGPGTGGGLLLLGGSPEAAAARLPWAVALAPGGGLAVLAVFALVAPLLRRLVPRPRAARVLTVLAGSLLVAADLPADGAALPLAVVALVATALLEQAYHRWGLLAVLVTAYASGAALRSVALLVQPGLFLKLSGGFAAILLLAACALGRVLADRWPAEILSAEALHLTARRWSRREQIKAQLEVAREAQSRMLPAAPPAIAGWSLAASCHPAREVGGDLYDFVPLGDRWAIAQGDVSGKGMVASLYMTLTKGLLLAATEHLETPMEVLSAVNDGLYRETERDIFVTLWYGLLDPRDGRLIHARAGHNSVFWRRSGRRQTVALQPRGLAAGAVKTATFAGVLEDEEIRLEPGDALFIYTDGVSEAMDGERAEYGLGRLEAVVGETDGMGAEAALEHVLADVRAFCGGAPAHDDLTLIVIRFEGAPEAG